MKLIQLSTFLENKPGQLTGICKLLADNKINILTLTLADTRQFGILRLIIPEWEHAKKLLEDNGYTVNITEVLAFEVGDHPGGLSDLLALFEDCSLNIEYMYAFTSRLDDKAILIFRFDDPDTALAHMKARGVNVINSVVLYSKE
jgi:hypothetical protein